MRLVSLAGIADAALAVAVQGAVNLQAKTKKKKLTGCDMSRRLPHHLRLVLSAGGVDKDVRPLGDVKHAGEEAG